MLESERNKREAQELRMVLKGKALGVRDQIVAALTALGHKVETLDGDSIWCRPQITNIDGMWFHVIVKPTETSSGYRFRPTGKLCVSIGSFEAGGMKAYPEPKAGFDIAKLAGLISAAVRELAAAHDRKNQVAVEVEKLRRAFGHVGGLEIKVEHNQFVAEAKFHTAEAARSWLAGVFPKEKP